MKILHWGDLHLDPSTAENTRPAAAEILALARREMPDLIVNSGDLSMRRGHLTPQVALELRDLHVALAEIAPTIVVAGNHDLATGGSEVGMVMGALARAYASEEDLRLFERPGLCYLSSGLRILAAEREKSSELAIACLPYPSRHWLLAQRPELKADELNAALSAELLNVLHGLAAQIPAGERAILVYHGSIAGARTDSEQTMTTEMDLVLNEAEIPAVFEAVLCGHIHRHQQIGRSVYCGSPAPLTFAEARGEHGAVLWGFGSGTDSTGHVTYFHDFEHVPLPVAHPLITLDLRGEGARERRIEAMTDARVRVLLALKPGEDSDALRNSYISACTTLGACEVRVLIERPEEVRIAGPEVKADAAIESLLTIYCERHPEAAEIKEELVTWARSLEERLPTDARIAAAAAGYKLLRLEWSNWKSYGEGNSLTLAELGRLVSIEGENASGKSNAAELEAFALYGRFIRGRQSLSEAVRIGADTAFVAAEFEASGERWKVERRIKVNTRGVGSMDLALFRWGSAEWFPASLGTARETQAFMEQLVGPFELYCQTRFASQGQIDALLDLTPADLTDVLQQALATSVFEAREAVARPALACAERAAEKHEAGLLHWREMAGEREARAAEVDSQQAALGEARTGLERAEVARHEAETAVADRKREAEEISERVGRWEESLDKERAAAARVGALDSAITFAVPAIERAEQATAERAELPALIEQRATAAVSAQLRRERAAVAAGERRTLTQIERDLEAAVLRRQARAQELTIALSRLEQRAQAQEKRDTDAITAARHHGAVAIAVAEKAVHEAEARTRMVAGTPFGEKCIEAKCVFVKDAVGVLARLPEYVAARFSSEGAAERSIAAAETQRHDNGAQFAAEIATAQAGCAASRNGDRAPEEIELGERQIAHRIALAEAEAKVAEIQVDEVGAQRIEARIAGLEALAPVIEAGHAARARREVAEQELPQARAECVRLTAAHQALGERPCRARAQEALARANGMALQTWTALESKKDAVQGAVEALAQARARLEQCLEAGARIDAAGECGARLERARRVAAVYLAACGRDGLPFLMLERALPALEGHANHFLCEDAGSGLRVEIEGLRELQSGGQRSEVVIRYRNDLGTHSLAAASGFERVAIGYALRAALAQLQAEAQGLTVSHWIADEGWGVFDEVNIVRVGQPMLRRLAERFGRVIVISHQAPILAICDTRLRVEPDTARGSMLVAA